MIVYTANPPQRASRVFDSRKAATKFQERLTRKSSTIRQRYGIAVNYFGPGKGSQVRTKREVRVRVDYDANGKMLPRLEGRTRKSTGYGIVRVMCDDNGNAVDRDGNRL